MIKVGINGFGRIGKLVFRIIEDLNLENKNIQVTAINCPSVTSLNLKYLINYDSVHNLNKYDIELDENEIKVNGHKIILFRERDPSKIDWSKGNVDYVIDSTGVFKTIKKASVHLSSGVKKVIITAPSEDAPMYVVGVNTDKYENSQRIVSNSSCTTNCLAPVAKVINDNFKIKKGFISTVHSITSSQNTLDGRNAKKMRIGRSCQNIIPSTTGATKALGVVIPDLNNKIDGLSYRVPTCNVSIIDFTFETEKETTYSEIIQKIKEESNGKMKGILSYTEEELVSSDYIGNTNSSIVDIKLGKEIGKNFFKVVAWYDNEWGYSCRVVDLLKIISK